MNRRAVLSLIASMPLAACAPPPSPVFEEAGAAPYALGTGDKLRVIVFGQDNLSNVYAVDSVGRISMPLVDVVPVAGLTTQQAERAIEPSCATDSSANRGSQSRSTPFARSTSWARS